MNKILCFILMSLSLFCSNAQNTDYAPLCEEGKVWHYAKGHPIPPYYETFEMDYYYYYFVDGDTVIANLPCKKVYSYNENNSGSVSKFFRAVYEEDRKVYQIGEGGEKTLLMDFGVEPGDVVTLHFLNGKGVDFNVEEVRQVNIRGVNRRAIRVNTDRPDWWIEGIGSFEMGPFDAILINLVGSSTFYISCELNGKTICDDWDVMELEGYQHPVNADVNDDSTVDIDDVNIVVNHILGYITRPIVYEDVNGDGVVDIDDVNAVINQMLGK